ncbi:MAG: hypothetical protein C5B52_16590 [Bacteroidetes bacterium]|nr:MAG: hypothetical protein C5B52_16590 [Bacteroidota bacterium]
MKKVININFQGRVLPIEESAYEALKQYTESLRRYFANEEGRDEIINDIESRIAELFDEKLKKGAVCITDEDVSAVIVSMGRPEDFEEEDGQKSTSSSGAQSGGTYQEQAQQETFAAEPRRLYRADNDKVLGGVCAGLAHYLRIDPAVVRILFTLITFGGFGFGFLLYIVMWIILPSKSLVTNVRKRLYRNPDNSMIGGVASGLAAYFNIDVWIPRLIFLLPFLLSIIPNMFSGMWFHFNGPWVAFSGIGGTFFISYIILWIVLPRAVTASEKLEMRGEKIDLASIKNTVQEELKDVKGKSEKMASDIKQKTEAWSKEMSSTVSQKAQSFAAEVGPAARKTGTGIGNAIGILFKAFFLFIAGCIAFALLIVLIAALYSGVGVFPLKNFFLQGFWQNFFAWSVLTLFLGVPILAFVTWVVRRIIRVKSKSPYLGYVFGTLWIFGLISLFVLIGLVTRDFRTKTSTQQDVAVVAPSKGNLVIKVAENKEKYYGFDWFNDDYPLLSLNEDSMLLNTVRVKLVKSDDSSYHIQTVRFARGSNPAIAETNASRINFPVVQSDTVLYLPKGFAISQESKFRNQQVMVVVEIPVGKRIMVDKSVNWYNWFEINVDRRRGWNIQWNDKWDNSYYWNDNVQYIMTNDGLKSLDNSDEDSDKPKKGKARIKIDEHGVDIQAEDNSDDDGSYRYKRKVDSLQKELKRVDSIQRAKEKKAIEDSKQSKTVNEDLNDGTEEKGAYVGEMPSPFAFILNLIN